MIRSMYSGISGLKNFQTKLDVIGNNIANVNTYGFKKGRTVFKDLYSQTVAGATGPGDTRGGVNPKQVGLGAQLATIDTMHSPGSTQFTGNTLDLAIEGDGFFIVEDGNDEKLYTRAGNFYLDKDGNIVDGDGRYLSKEGGGSIEVPLEATSLSIGQDGVVKYVLDGILEGEDVVALAKFSNPGGLTKIGGNLYQESANSGVAEDGTGAPLIDGRGAIKSGSLEMSNVDLSEEFTEMIVAQRGFQANTRIITTSDEILQELVNLKR
ncbi:flagellar basal body rod protein FlgG [Sporosarcina sp. P12(2017)]|uniref:Flagellar hook protein FlgE n=1 Tax=Sporosarcina ureae TaxID=1571 RepID=A0ABM6JYL9_SPOUR|nr:MULTISPECIES: flagellar basal body rod protein FlgG [Sporosarcina]ARF15323.1 flagellar basal-body rod protein FlgG [Sporosarcina ureae]PIC58787.1 flagellar basal body rod protein FlgG [Sporosarcina sp. P10]PIC62107.1 flagellar basal body rod protein FlgG [Sporosarcina sp. P12(2017)]PIC78245.1 flagellar basal body rod protein FlgG [Sporosarcina sp. P19]